MVVTDNHMPGGHAAHAWLQSARSSLTLVYGVWLTCLESLAAHRHVSCVLRATTEVHWKRKMKIRIEWNRTKNTGFHCLDFNSLFFNLSCAHCGNLATQTSLRFPMYAAWRWVAQHTTHVDHRLHISENLIIPYQLWCHIVPYSAEYGVECQYFRLIQQVAAKIVNQILWITEKSKNDLLWLSIVQSFPCHIKYCMEYSVLRY